MTSPELSRPIVIGAGPVGRALAAKLHAMDLTPTVVTRSGATLKGSAAVSADVANPAEAKAALADATVVFQCAQPPYHRWVDEFRAFQESVLAGCEASGALLIAVENVYGYGPVTTPMTEQTPLITSEGTKKGRVRAQAWRDLEAAHTRGRVRCAAVRASDFIGPHVKQSVFGERFFGPLLAGKSAELLGPATVRHTATNVGDLAEAMVAVAARPDTWGTAWHAPSAPAATFEEIVAMAAAAAGVDAKHRTTPAWLLRVVGLFNKDAGELVEMLYQFNRNFVVDSTATEAALGLSPTPLNQSIAETVAWFKANAD